MFPNNLSENLCILGQQPLKAVLHFWKDDTSGEADGRCGLSTDSAYAPFLTNLGAAGGQLQQSVN